MKNLSVIVALAENGIIGREGQLPWRLSADLQRFKRLTMGHHLIMGRHTYESIGRPLPGRTTIVVTRQDRGWPGVLTARSLRQAYDLAQGDSEIFVVGGDQIYRQALPDAQRLYITLVHAHVDGDARFAEVDWSQWQVVEEQWRDADERNEYPMTFRVYRRSE